MEPVITSKVVVAYSQCPRKAYLLMFSPDEGEPHEYVQILEQERRENQERYIDRLKQKYTDVQLYTADNLRKGNDVLINARLQADGFEAECGVLTRAEGKSALGKHNYEPTICVGTHTVSKEQKLEVAFVGYALERLQNKPPVGGRIIGMNGSSHTVKLENGSKDLLPILEPLQEWISADSPEPPPIVLNKHCSLCPFQQPCQTQAEREDNLSLLNGVSPRVMRQYERKGIFTVRQLSYLFKPRKRKKRSRNPPPVTHKVELQALAIRENKIYLQELPEIARQPVELFLDIEGVPDRGLYYLIGLLSCEGNATEHHSFWADTDQDEGNIWQQFVDKTTQYPDAPIYHYGSYEPRAISTLARRYQTNAEGITKRLVNVNGHIYSKVYFPVRSNSLKDIGSFIGAKWTSPDASGLQSLVWLHHWETTHHIQYKTHLLTYNSEDCHALKSMVDELSKIQFSADVLSKVEFADKRKTSTTEVSEEIHSQFGAILKFAHFDYDKKKISFRKDVETNESTQDRREKKKHAAYISTQKFVNIEKKAKKVIKVGRTKVCPKCGNRRLRKTEKTSHRTIIDLVLTKNGIRKSIIRYEGTQGYCLKCQQFYAPPEIRKYRYRELYGDGFKAWIVYQRIALRMSYGSILESAEGYFDEKITSGRLPSFIRTLGQRYAPNEEIIIQKLLSSPFIHADETKVNIQGTNQYVWVFTDGQYVIFKLTESRESTIVHELLKNYEGTLISDFYPGYDSVKYRQQKCWVHLIRNLNDDLLASPFDTELELFTLEVKNLIVPIMESVQKYGLKKRNLYKFQHEVSQFYKMVITDRLYKSDRTNTYQKLFIRYQDCLFTFLDQDGIPWHNNTAERAIRHISKQRAISPNFYASVMHDYLILLGIRQACRFQGKSFLKFLFSDETDLDKFQTRKRKR